MTEAIQIQVDWENSPWAKLDIWAKGAPYPAEFDPNRDAMIAPDGVMFPLNYWEHYDVSLSICEEMGYDASDPVDELRNRGFVHHGGRWSFMGCGYFDGDAGYTQYQRATLMRIINETEHSNIRAHLEKFLRVYSVIQYDLELNAPKPPAPITDEDRARFQLLSQFAEEFALEMGHDSLGTEHLFVAAHNFPEFRALTQLSMDDARRIFTRHNSVGYATQILRRSGNYQGLLRRMRDNGNAENILRAMQTHPGAARSYLNEKP